MPRTRLSDSIAGLAPARGKEGRPGVATAPSPIAGKTGRGTVKLAEQGAGGGIASPLTEADYDARTYHPEQVVVSSDGLFALRVRSIASITMADADDAPAVLNFAAPT